jgi:hypothetical protein
MKALLFTILTGSLLASSPALAGGGRNGGSQISSSTICELASPTSTGSGRKGGTLGVPYEAYIAYVAGGGTMTWNQFFGYVMSSC